MTPRENNLQRPAKGGFTPAFACQRAAIAPLPCLNLQPSSLSFNFVRIGKFQKRQLQQGKQVAKCNLLRKCGLLAHTSAAFLKNCCTEKLFHCLRLAFCNQYPCYLFRFIQRQNHFLIRQNFISHPLIQCFRSHIVWLYFQSQLFCFSFPFRCNKL